MKAAIAGVVAGGLSLGGSCTTPVKTVDGVQFVTPASPLLKVALEMTGAGGLTIGNTVLVRDAEYLKDNDFVPHELVHSRQWKKHGLWFIPRYLAASAAALLRGQNGYFNNELECQAFEWEDATKGISDRKLELYADLKHCSVTDRL